MKHLHLMLVLVALALVAAACSGDDEPTSTTTELTTLAPVTTEATTTTAAPTTTTQPETLSFLNGMPIDDPEADMGRRVVAVKIDNHPDARPQSAVHEADAMMEMIVEAGITRFIALFHESDSEYVGPVRSGRPTDPTLLESIGATFQISGAQPWVQSLISAAGVPFLGETQPNTFRISQSGRAYERTLYASTPGIREVADSREYPDDPPAEGSWFTFGDAPEPTEDAELVTLSWSSQWPAVNWEWDGEQYLRSTGDTPHNWIDIDGGTDQIAADTLVVLTATQYTASGSSGSPVPALETVGEGTAYLFHDGGVVEGTWQRESAAEWFELTTADGDEMVLPAGRLWLNVFPNDRPATWE